MNFEIQAVQSLQFSQKLMFSKITLQAEVLTCFQEKAKQVKLVRK